MSSIVDLVVQEGKNLIIAGRHVQYVPQFKDLVEKIGWQVVMSKFAKTESQITPQSKPSPLAVFMTETKDEGMKLKARLEGVVGQHAKVFLLEEPLSEDGEELDSLNFSGFDILILPSVGVGILMILCKFGLDKCKNFVMWYLSDPAPEVDKIRISLRGKTPLGFKILSENLTIAKEAMHNLDIGIAEAWIIFLPIVVDALERMQRRNELQTKFRNEYASSKAVVICTNQSKINQIAPLIQATGPNIGGSTPERSVMLFNGGARDRICVIANDVKKLDFNLIDLFIDYDPEYLTWGLAKLGSSNGFIFHNLKINRVDAFNINM